VYYQQYSVSGNDPGKFVQGHSFKPDSSGVASMLLISNDSALIVGFNKGAIRFFACGTWEETHVISVNTTVPYGLAATHSAFSAFEPSSSDRLVIARGDSTIQVFDLSSKEHMLDITGVCWFILLLFEDF
jgi:hypothetical protein